MGRPELYEQFVRILDLTDPAGGGKGLDLNMLESFLIPEIRETGRIATQDFAQQIEQSIGQEVNQQDGAHEREKKLIVYGVYGLIKVDERIFQTIHFEGVITSFVYFQDVFFLRPLIKAAWTNQNIELCC